MTKLKTQIVTKLKNSNNDKTQKLELWQNSKKLIVEKLTKISNCDKTQKSYGDIIQRIQLWHNSTNPIVTKLKNSNYDINLSDSSCSGSRGDLLKSILCVSVWHEKGTFLLISLSQILYYTL